MESDKDWRKELISPRTFRKIIIQDHEIKKYYKLSNYLETIEIWGENIWRGLI